MRKEGVREAMYIRSKRRENVQRERKLLGQPLTQRDTGKQKNKQLLGKSTNPSGSSCPGSAYDQPPQDTAPWTAAVSISSPGLCCSFSVCARAMSKNSWSIIKKGHKKHQTKGRRWHVPPTVLACVVLHGLLGLNT